MDADKIGICPLDSKTAEIFLSLEFSCQAELNFPATRLEFYQVYTGIGMDEIKAGSLSLWMPRDIYSRQHSITRSWGILEK